MEKIKIIIAAATSGMREQASIALDSENLQTVASITPDSAGLNKAGFMPADVLVLASDYLDSKEADFVERLYMTRPNLISVLLTTKTDAEMLQRAMLCGITRTINISESDETPVDAIMAAFNREKNRKNVDSVGAVRYESKVLSFFGTKGGVGKTTVAVNVAVSLAKMNKRVALIDLDLQFGDVGIFLDISKADTIVDIVEVNNYDYSSLTSFLHKHSSGVRVLCAPNAPEYAEMIRPEHVEKIIVGLRSEFDYIILDMPPAFNDISLAALENSSEVYFVINPDIPSLRNAQVSLSVFEQINMSDKLQIIINKDGNSNLSRKDIEQVLNRKAVLTIPCDYKNSTKAVNRGVPIVISYKTSKVAVELNKFAEKILGENQKSTKK